MSKPVKNMLMRYLRDRYAEVDSACVVDVTGMDVATTESLRERLRDKNARMEIVKNRQARRAWTDLPLRPLGEALQGPCALVTGESIVEAAKELVSFAKQVRELKLKHAIIEGDPDLLTVEDLSRMKSRIEMLGELAMLISSPGRRLCGAIASPQAKIAGCIKSIADKE